MRFILAPDSYKECMTAIEACKAMKRGILKADKNACVSMIPMADGGEGLIDAFKTSIGGEVCTLNVKGPINNNVEARFLLTTDQSDNNKTAVIEMAEASGLSLVKGEGRNPFYTTTYGTGELIKASIDKGIEKIIIGIGGSATNDGGAGVLQALGVKLLDEEGAEIDKGGLALKKLYRIDMTNIDKRIYNIHLIIACDVTNTLLGANGASYIFGPQKGANAQMVKVLDDALSNYAHVVKEQFGKDIAAIKGGGAAGGLGATLIGLLNGEFKSGIDTVIEYSNLEQKIKNADFVFTGEGGIDYQTAYGKTPYGVAKVAKKYSVPVIAFAGNIGDGIDSLYALGITSIIGINRGACSLEKALKYGRENLELAAENVARIIMAGYYN